MLSPTCSYVDDIENDIKQADLGVLIDELNFNLCVVYADDVVVVAEIDSFTKKYKKSLKFMVE